MRVLGTILVVSLARRVLPSGRDLLVRTAQRLDGVRSARAMRHDAIARCLTRDGSASQTTPRRPRLAQRYLGYRYVLRGHLPIGVPRPTAFDSARALDPVLVAGSDEPQFLDDLASKFLVQAMTHLTRHELHLCGPRA